MGEPPEAEETPMSIDRRLRLGSAAAVLLLAALGPACHRPGSRPVAGSLPPAPPPVVETAPPAPVPPPPGRFDQEMRAADEAERGGDYQKAVETYERIVSSGADPSALADARYRLALAYLDPNSPSRSADQSLKSIEDLLRDSPGHPRSREARTIKQILVELKQAIDELAQARGDIEASRTQLQALQARFDEKEQELKRIKEVLLEKKP